MSTRKKHLFETKYGYFTQDGRSYVITRPDTPRPWVNIFGNERYGLVVSQAGGGFSWLDHSTLSVLTRWEMDLIRDARGRWIYLHESESGKTWSASFQPTLPHASGYSCIHGIGYTILKQRVQEIETEWTLTIPPDSTFELWEVKIRNVSNRPRRLGVCSHLSWCLGAAPDSKREFHRLFHDTAYHPEKGLISARKHIWEVPDEKRGHWNTTWPHAAFHQVWLPGGETPEKIQATGDHEMFLGRHGDWKNPAWVTDPDRRSCGFGRHQDPVAALYLPLELAPGEEKIVMFSLGAAENEEDIESLVKPFQNRDAMEKALESVKEMWNSHLDAVQVNTPDPAFNILNNTWLPYQAISSRLWGRTGYWQQSGAFGFRDQLQDSHVFLPHAPHLCKRQIRLHARHQFEDGAVYHWWHPLSEVGLRTKMTDDLLWLPFVLLSYLKETGDLGVLMEKEPFVDQLEETTLWDHCERAIEKVLARFSTRGLPLIGEGDWNDGLSACGLEGKGESVWLGHFLHLILNQWSLVAEKRGEGGKASNWKKRANQLRDAVNQHGWDEKWYLRATLDDGSPLGSARNDEARIFLNSQTWAILSGTADENRAEMAMDAVEKHLLREYGPLLFSPAFSIPDPRVGYLTRYAPGTRENGGLYTHAATWAIQAACKMGRPETAWKMFNRLSPPDRGLDPVQYMVEPYVTPGNVEGPDSPHFGRGGWTWYTGSAAWLRKICLEWILGIRPEWEGLLVVPCLPPHWSEAKISRPFQGDTFDIIIKNPDHRSKGTWRIELDGSPHIFGKPIPASGENMKRFLTATLEPKDAKRSDPSG